MKLKDEGKIIRAIKSAAQRRADHISAQYLQPRRTDVVFDEKYMSRPGNGKAELLPPLCLLSWHYWYNR